MPDIADVAWSEHDERNTEAVPNGWPTGAFPAYTDLVGQMMMGATKRFWNKINPVYQTSGTGDDYVVQTEIGIDQINLYEILCIRIDRSNTTTTPTLQFGATNARTIVKAGPSGYVPLAAGDMYAGNSHTFWYNGAFYVLTDPAIIVGGTVQPYSPNLTSWAAITRATGFDTWVASPTSANLAALVGDETGTGALVFGTGPTLSAPLLAGGTSGTTTLQASANASGTLTFPAATDTLVGRATTDTLTNKTIDGSNNTITNVSLTTGVTGTLPIGNGGTGQITAAAGFDALSPTTTRGDLIFRNATTNARLAPSTAGYHLQTNGAGTDPTWSGFTQPTSGSPATRTWQSKVSDCCDLRDWSGLDLTGATDMASIVQAAVNSAAAAGVVLRVPAGKITLGSKITIPEGANIEGPGVAADREGAFSAYNAYFHLAHSDIGFHCTGIAGPSSSGGPRRLAGFGTYRDHPALGAGWAPTAASADVQITAVHDVLVEDILFYNANRAVTLNGDPATGIGSGRVTLRRLRGQPMLYGLNIQQVYDTIYIDDIHWWPYWSFDANVLAYMKANGTACLMGRVDWPQIGRIFSWGLKDGLSIVNTAASGSLLGGTLNGAAHIDSLTVDNCERGLLIGAGADGVTLDIDHAYMTNTVYAASAMVTLAGNNARLSVKTLYGGNTNGSLVSIGGSGNDVRLGGSRSSGIDHDATGDAEFNVANGNKLTLATPPITSAGTVYSSTGEIVPRGIVPDRQITTVQGSTVALSNSSTSAQNIFAAANDTLTLLGSTSYRFRAHLRFNQGTTSHNVSFGLGGTATFTSISYLATVADGPANTANAPTLRRVDVATAATMRTASVAATIDIILEGIMRINAAGTIIPQITFSAGPGGTCETAVNSFFEVEKIGSDTVAATGNWG